MLTGQRVWRSAVQKLWNAAWQRDKGRRRCRLRDAGEFSVLGVAAAIETLEARQLLTAGAIDTTFGSGGMTVPLTTHPTAAATAVQSNGDTIVASSYWTNSGQQNQNHLVLARYTTSGTLDTSFGTNGVVDLTYGKYAVITPDSVAIQADGKILVAGALDGNVVTGGFSNNAIVVLRFDADGSVDSKFGTKGEFTYYPGSGNNTTQAMAVDPQGRMILGIRLYNSPSNYGIDLVRVTSSGKLDATFGNQGLEVVPGTLGAARAVALEAAPSDPNGYQILVGGLGPVAPSGVEPHYQAMLARFNSNGTLDTTFGNGGMLLFSPPLDPSQSAAGQIEAGAAVNSLVLEADGSVVVVGYVNSSANNVGDGFVAHFNANGILDSSFGNGGYAVTANSPEGYQFRGFTDAMVDASGNIVVAATATSSTGAGYAALIRYTSTGQLDTTFGADGTGFVFAGPGLSAVAISIDPTTGKLIETINGNSGFQLLRYLAS
jgi:uncharacterized delta-60 repeat protein